MSDGTRCRDQGPALIPLQRSQVVSALVQVALEEGLQQLGRAANLVERVESGEQRGGLKGIEPRLSTFDARRPMFVTLSAKQPHVPGVRTAGPVVRILERRRQDNLLGRHPCESSLFGSRAVVAQDDLKEPQTAPCFTLSSLTACQSRLIETSKRA